MRRPVPRAREVFGSRPPDVDDDGSGGRFVRGLPVGFLPDGYAPDLTPNPPLDWDAQGGAPHGVSSSQHGPRSGGGYVDAVDRGGAPLSAAPAAPDPSPFQLKR